MSESRPDEDHRGCQSAAGDLRVEPPWCEPGGPLGPENGWELRQQQQLDRAGAEELIFAARPDDLDQPSARELLQEEVGLTPEDADAMLERVDERVERSGP